MFVTVVGLEIFKKFQLPEGSNIGNLREKIDNPRLSVFYVNDKEVGDDFVLAADSTVTALSALSQRMRQRIRGKYGKKI